MSLKRSFLILYGSRNDKSVEEVFLELYFFFIFRWWEEKFVRIGVLLGQLSLKWMGVIKRSIKFSGVLNLP